MFACIFIPNFPVTAIIRAEPELCNLAVGIFEGKPPLEKIIALNESAEHFGIVEGMTKAQAELCGELALRARSIFQESATHAALLDCAQSFSPCVEDAGSDTAVLGLTGMESLFGPAQEIANAISIRSAEFGLSANIAVASSPDAALLAARGFSGVTVIPHGKEAERLGPLAIEILFSDSPKSDPQKEEPEGLCETLKRWGVRDLRALAALPEIELSQRLGQEGLRLQRRARGEASRTLVPVEEPLVFEEAIDLEFPIVLLEPLLFLLNRLLEQICARLSARALATQELRLTMELECCADRNQPSPVRNELSGSQATGIQRKGVFQRRLRLPVPMLDCRLFLKLVQLDLNANSPGAPIRKIHLAAEPARPRYGQAGLFLPPSPEPEKLELTLARIAGIVGEERVGAIELLDTHRAEGFRMKRFKTPAATVSRHNPKDHKSAIAALRRFRPPLGARVKLENGAPAHVVTSKNKEVQGPVLWKAGPWRSSGDWWDREAWSRDEWDIAVQKDGCVALYRLVHDLLNNVWFLEGAYD